MKISSITINQQIKQSLNSDGISEFYPPQLESLQRGLMEGENITAAVPTASGKTLIAELAILSSWIRTKKKAVYLCPLRALASEKYQQFKRLESRFGLHVGIATGDLDEKDAYIGRSDIIVTTNEKMDTILRRSERWIFDVGVLIVDEVHLINDYSRGPTLEVVVGMIKYLLPECQIIALSATIRNADQISKWLKAHLIQSDWRPVDLREGIYSKGKVQWADGATTVHADYPLKITESSPLSNGAVNLAIETVHSGGQSIIFGNTRRNVQSLAKKCAKELEKTLQSQNNGKVLLDLSEEIKQFGERTDLEELLAELVKHGVAFHHAGLRSVHRTKIENAFKENQLKIICATPTLAQGVNLPARRVIVSSLHRYDKEMGRQTTIPVIEYKQQAGRAGRPQYDTFGEAIIMSKDDYTREEQFQIYLTGDLEDVHSKLGSAVTLRKHLLALIATEIAKTPKEILEFLSATFYGHMFGQDKLISPVKESLKFLITERLVSGHPQESILESTDFGKEVVATYLDPYDAVLLRDGFERTEKMRAEEIDLIHILTLLASTSQAPKRPVLSREKSEYIQFAYEKEEGFLLPIPEGHDEFEYQLQCLKSATIIYDWIDEMAEKDIIEKHKNVQGGDIQYWKESYSWLLRASSRIASLFEYEKIIEEIKDIQLRVEHGIKAELLPLVKMKDIGRRRARDLYNNGYTSKKKISKASIDELASVKGIGRKLAKSLKLQTGSKIPVGEYIGEEFDLEELQKRRKETEEKRNENKKE